MEKNKKKLLQNKICKNSFMNFFLILVFHQKEKKTLGTFSYYFSFNLISVLRKKNL